MADNGLAAFDASIDRIQKHLTGDALKPAAAAAADVIAQHARELIPVRTGETLDSIEVAFEVFGVSVNAVIQVAKSGPDQPEHQAVFLEYGTKNMAARPFMRPAFELGKNAAIAAATAALKSKITG